MGNHDHHGHCRHALAFCERCDRPYCVKCNREWYTQTWYYPTWYTYTSPSWTTSSTTTLTSYEVSDHSGH